MHSMTMMLPFVMTPIETALVLPLVAPVPPVPPLQLASASTVPNKRV